jgi:hypothetical protein
VWTVILPHPQVVDWARKLRLRSDHLDHSGYSGERSFANILCHFDLRRFGGAAAVELELRGCGASATI